MRGRTFLQDHKILVGMTSACLAGIDLQVPALRQQLHRPDHASLAHPDITGDGGHGPISSSLLRFSEIERIWSAIHDGPDPPGRMNQTPLFSPGAAFYF